MTQATDQYVKVGRSYTRARRFPWVIGKIQGWTIPLGPYTATQLGVLIGGLFLLVKTFDLWRRLGALAVVVIALPFVATWAVRHAHIDGRTPMRALAGFAALFAEPQCGRINGRLARDIRPATLTGTVRLSRLPDPHPAPQPATRPDAVAARPTPTVRPALGVHPASPAPPAPAAAPGPAVHPPPAVHPAPAIYPASGTRPVPGTHPTPGVPQAPAVSPKPAAPPGPVARPRPATRPAPTALQALLAASTGKED
ncbi:TcpE family conjugal transfer membrane protein [Spirillospora sp. NBC_00431]